MDDRRGSGWGVALPCQQGFECCVLLGFQGERDIAAMTP
jgi:hypothetical protein